MAYDPTKDPNADPNALPASQYASLLPSATPAAPAVATPHVKAPTGPGFVSGDRLINANKTALTNQQNAAESTAMQQQAALQSQLGTVQNDLTSKATSAAPSTEDRSISSGQNGALKGLANTSRDQAETYANAQYTGPTRQDTTSRYAPLLTQANALTSRANAAQAGDFSGYGINSFDAGLMGARAGAQGLGTLAGGQGLATQANASLDAAHGAVDAAQKTTGENASKWKTLLGKYDATAADAKETSDRNTSAADKRMWTDAMAKVRLQNGVAPDVTYDGHRPTGVDVVEALNSASAADTLSGVPVGFLTHLGWNAADQAHVAKVVDKMSPTEVQQLLNSNPRANPNRFAQAVNSYAQKYGVGSK